ncbi:MAG: hypothetical protein NVSMB9_21210 [Isosphaeraceae bacterium]
MTSVSLCTVVVLTTLHGQSTCLAETRQPSRKDSSLRAKPKDVVLTPSVTPSQARPGDTVVYRVTAKLNPGWHIYTYAKEQSGEGPRNTQFDFFDLAGLTREGEWNASEAPLRKKEPAFPDIDAVSFHIGQVSWSLSLKIPLDAAAGRKTLRCQANYQICDENSCSVPGFWTLPDVVLTILPGSPDQKTSQEGPGTSSAKVSNRKGEPKPKKKDSPPRSRPKGVSFSTSIKPQEARAGETIRFQVTAKLKPGWHIYDYSKVQPDEGPRVTELDLFESAGLLQAGEWKADRAPHVAAESAFNNQLVSYFENEVTWSLALKIPDDVPAETRTLRCQVAFQICDPSSCSPPGRWTLPDATLKILPGSSTSASASGESKAPVSLNSEIVPEKNRESVARAVTPSGKVESEVEKKARQGIFPLMIASALGGLLALVMPCVWPMVPITVNFFVKQGQSGNVKGRTTGLAIIYCLAIIGVFTSMGVLCSFFVSATALPKLANNPWLNFGVAGLFLAFGLSLLGLFEIRLPNSLLNASSRRESHGGLVGVVFMALTLTITSFTCTFPVVGGLLVMASAGEVFYPIIGLATFSTVLALPFFLLALSPGLLARVPKSGDWMNTVKVVGGLIEIGAAFKFMNTAELAFVTPDHAWFDAQLVLTAWVVLSSVCGFYLLGFFRTDHDYEEAKVGAGRMLLGTGFLGFALFLAPALFGRPPQSPLWEQVVGLLPPDVSELSESPIGLAGRESPSMSQDRLIHATDSDPTRAERQEKRFHGVQWGFSYEEALEKSRAEKKPVLIDFTGVNCANCRKMEQAVLPNAAVVSLLGKFVTVQLHTDFVPIPSITADQRAELAENNMGRLIRLVNDNTNPFYVVLSPDGEVLGQINGYREVPVFVDFLKSSLNRFKGENRVAHSISGS